MPRCILTSISEGIKVSDGLLNEVKKTEGRDLSNVRETH